MIKTYILQGEHAESFAQGMMALQSKEAPAIVKLESLAPAHVNCVRIAIALPAESDFAEMTGMLSQFAANVGVALTDDDFVFYGMPQ